MDIDNCFLSQLPAELLLLIIGACPRQRDLASWSQTNQYFHSVVNPILYEKEITKKDWRTVVWAADHGVAGTLRHWVSIRNIDGSIRAPLDVYTTRTRNTVLAVLGDAPLGSHTALFNPYVLGPLDQKTREQFARCHAPLHIAARNGHADVVEFLLDHGADINAHSVGYMEEGLSIFHDARDRHSYFDLNCITLNALHIAILSGHSEVAKILLRRGIDLAITPLRAGHDSNITALHLVAAYPYHPGNLEILKMIGERPDVDIDAPDIDGQTPLMYAAETQGSDFPAFQVLKDLGANLNCVIRTPDGVEAPLLVALIRRIRWKAAVKLIDVGANLDVKEGQRSLLEECNRARMSVIYPEVIDREAYAELFHRLERQVSTPPQSKEDDRNKSSNILRRVVKLVRR